MALTDEQNKQINDMRIQLTNMLTTLNSIAASAGANPTPLADETPVPITVMLAFEPPVFKDPAEAEKEGLAREAALAAKVVAQPPPPEEFLKRATEHPAVPPET
jgi:hypothetical protein